MESDYEIDVMEGYNLLEKKGVSRRDFLNLCALSCLAFGLDGCTPLNLDAQKTADAAVVNLYRKPLVWLQGQGCTGCSSSLIASIDPGPDYILLDLLSVRFHPTIMAATGGDAVGSLEHCISQGNYLLILEGAIPTADPRFCTVEGKPFLDLFKKAAAKADLIIAAGSCASYGGIPRAGHTGSVGVQAVIADKQIINLPSCPVKPDRLLGTVLYYLANNQLPRLDSLGRPVAYYRYTLHDSCHRRLHHKRGEFLSDWNDPRTVDYCLYYKGCKGQKTFTNCASHWWNDGVSYCGAVGSPCSGCSQPEFYEKFSPLFTNPKEVS